MASGSTAMWGRRGRRHEDTGGRPAARVLGPINQCGVAPRLSAPLRCGENLLEQATDGFWAGWMVALASDPVVETR